MTVSERIFALLDAQNKRQADLVRALNVRPNTVSDWKAKRRNPDVVHLEGIARFFNVSIDYLVTGKSCAVNGLDLSQRHIALLLYILQSGYAARSTVPDNLCGDITMPSGKSTAIEYLEKCDLIYRVPDVDVPKNKYIDGDDHYRVTERGSAYVENHCDVTSSVMNNQCIIGNGNNNSVTIHGNGTVQLSEFESELLRIYGTLDTERKTALLMYAYELRKCKAEG